MDELPRTQMSVIMFNYSQNISSHVQKNGFEEFQIPKPECFRSVQRFNLFFRKTKTNIKQSLDQSEQFENQEFGNSELRIRRTYEDSLLLTKVGWVMEFPACGYKFTTNW